jgi:branched-chain amino acid transport system permease protein
MRTVIQNAIDAISLGSLYALLSLGIALIFGIMHLMNFAHAALIMVGAYSVLILLNAGLPLSLVIALTLLIVVLFAVAIERVAFRPIRLATPATLLITSFAVTFLLTNLAQLIFGSNAQGVGFSPIVTQFFPLGTYRIPKSAVLIVAATAFVLVVLGLFLKRTSIGIQMRAAAEDFRMARLLGVKANRVVVTAFAVSGVLAGTASILFVAQTGSVDPTIGLSPLLLAFVATVIGGMGSLWGAALGGMILGVLTIVLQTALPLAARPFRDALTYGIVIAILLVRPQGLFVRSEARSGYK